MSDTRQNGQGMPVDWEGVSTDTIQRMELAYQEIQRRDSQIEMRHAKTATLLRLQWAMILALVVALIALMALRQQIKAFVQTVQVRDDGTLVQLGVPQDLYAYQPADGSYMEMVAQWVRWTRWRGEDAQMLKAQWAWAYRHSCGSAAKDLKRLEDTQRPFQPSPKRVAVTLKSVTKIAAPESYQVVWEESATEVNAPTVKTQQFTGTFTVGRRVLKNMEDILDNRLGLCIAAYELSAQPQG